jgi:hypothetical protein
MDDVRRFALALPGVTDGRSYGLPALLLNGKFFARYHKEDDSVVIAVGTMRERDFLLGHDPRVFFITDHYRNCAAVLVRPATVSHATLETLLLDACCCAPRRPLRILPHL